MQNDVLTLTRDQERAIEIAMRGGNLNILGASGTGKSVLIRELVRRMENQSKKVYTTATTGIAADHINGYTLNRVLGTFNGRITDKTDFEMSADRIKDADAIIIDEVSMMTPMMCEYLKMTLDHVNKSVQIIPAGDFKQLGPVLCDYVFTCKAWKELGFNYIELQEVVRQKDAMDKDFLRRVSEGEYDKDYFDNYLEKNTSDTEFYDDIYLCPTNDQMRIVNAEKTVLHPGRGITFVADCDSEIDFKSVPLEKNLLVKRYMPVMAQINDRKGRFKNGSRGIVLDINETRREVIVDFEKTGITVVTYTDIPYETENKKYIISQIPLRPAYASTIHKSQGQTFERINVFCDKCTYPGQFYTALSRSVSLNKIHLMGEVDRYNFAVSPEVLSFYKTIRAKAA
jgi:ATP-dependent exoDNAse (exonuclease V) alpha subunit